MNTVAIWVHSRFSKVDYSALQRLALQKSEIIQWDPMVFSAILKHFVCYADKHKTFCISYENLITRYFLAVMDHFIPNIYGFIIFHEDAL